MEKSAQSKSHIKQSSLFNFFAKTPVASQAENKGEESLAKKDLHDEVRALIDFNFQTLIFMILLD